MFDKRILSIRTIWYVDCVANYEYDCSQYHQESFVFAETFKVSQGR
jgi:hypothetical protein